MVLNMYVINLYYPPGWAITGLQTRIHLDTSKNCVRQYNKQCESRGLTDLKYWCKPM